jgi:hypothetical protein
MKKRVLRLAISLAILLAVAVWLFASGRIGGAQAREALRLLEQGTRAEDIAAGKANLQAAQPSESGAVYPRVSKQEASYAE